MADARFCAACGAPLPPNAQFCPVCATLVVANPQPPVPPAEPTRPAAVVTAVDTPAPAPDERRSRTTTVILISAAAAVLLAIIAFALLTGMPFRSDSDIRRPPSLETTATVAEAPPPASQPPLVTTEGSSSALPPMPGVLTDSPPAPQPAPVESAPVEPPPAIATQPPSPSEISESDAMAVLAGKLRAAYPDVASSCIEIRSEGYVNAGYTMDVLDNCRGQRLDRWRVDARTREVFRQRADGRFLAP